MFTDIEKSHEILGITDHALFSYKNMNFMNENHREMVECIEDEIRRYKPDVIFYTISMATCTMTTELPASVPAKRRGSIAAWGRGIRWWPCMRWKSCLQPDGSKSLFQTGHLIMGEQSVSKKIQALGVQKCCAPHSSSKSEECIRALAIVRGSGNRLSLC